MKIFKNLKLILDNKAEFRRFTKLCLIFLGMLATIFFSLYMLFVFNWDYNKKAGLRCGGDPVNVKDLKK